MDIKIFDLSSMKEAKKTFLQTVPSPIKKKKKKGGKSASKLQYDIFRCL